MRVRLTPIEGWLVKSCELSLISKNSISALATLAETGPRAATW